VELLEVGLEYTLNKEGKLARKAAYLVSLNRTLAKQSKLDNESVQKYQKQFPTLVRWPWMYNSLALSPHDTMVDYSVGVVWKRIRI
jgi:hypothetical protein